MNSGNAQFALRRYAVQATTDTRHDRTSIVEHSIACYNMLYMTVSMSYPTEGRPTGAKDRKT